MASASHTDLEIDNEGILVENEKDFSHPFYKQISLMNGKINSYSRDELIKNLKILHLDSEGSRKVLAKRLKNFYKKTMLNVNHIQESHTSGKIKVTFDYLLVIDFEATCQFIKEPNFKQEIIEFPAILYNCQRCEVVDEFRSYCRPVLNPLLTDFCTDLTGITQEDIDKAPLFCEVLASFDEWVAEKKLGIKYSFAIVTDGPWDMGFFLKNQCNISRVEYPGYCKYWINIRKTFSNFYRTPKVPISTMLHIIGREFHGRAHSGIDDARNIAYIVQRLMKDGAKFVFNEKLAELSERKNRDDGTPLFAAPVQGSEYKSLVGNLRPNYPICRSNNKI